MKTKPDNDPYQGLEELLLRRPENQRKKKASRLTEESTDRSTPVTTGLPAGEPTKVPADRPGSQAAPQRTAQSATPAAREPPDRPEPQLRGELADQPTAQTSTEFADLAATATATAGGYQLVRRPVSFYLTVAQSQALDVLREHLRDEHRVVTDRSALLRAVLEPPVIDFYLEENHEELIRRLVAQLQRRFTGG